jgi:hypothetical protein
LDKRRQNPETNCYQYQWFIPETPATREELERRRSKASAYEKLAEERDYYKSLYEMAVGQPGVQP